MGNKVKRVILCFLAIGLAFTQAGASGLGEEHNLYWIMKRTVQECAEYCLCRYEVESAEYEEYALPFDRPFLLDSDGEVLIATVEEERLRIYRFDRESETFTEPFDPVQIPELVAPFALRNGRLYYLAVKSDGYGDAWRIATCEQNGTHAETITEWYDEVNLDDPFFRFSVSGDGTLAVLGVRCTVYRGDMDLRLSIREVEGWEYAGFPSAVSWMSDGRLLVIDHRRSSARVDFIVYDTETNSLSIWNKDFLRWHVDLPDAANMTPDGQYLATISSDWTSYDGEGRVSVLNTQNGTWVDFCWEGENRSFLPAWPGTVVWGD